MNVNKCSKCNEDPVTLLRYSGQHLCRKHFLRFFDKRAKMDLAGQGKLPEGRIAVALSGGKDSVAAMHWMHEITKGHPRIELCAITVDEGIAGYRNTSLEICQEVTNKLGVPWTTVTTREMAGYTIDDYAAGRSGPDGNGEDRPACGACGVFRRHGLNEAALKAGAAAIVTGHNLDDMAQTILMNHLKGDVDRLARLAPHESPQDGLVPRLIPFRSIPEKEVLLYAVLHNLPVHDEAECPYAVRSNRFEMRDVLVGLEKRHPGTRHALLRGAQRIKSFLPASSAPINKCVTCGGPTSATICKVCHYRA